ncbi:hypothetical protein Q1695_003084 [Nippostrongylus brasiliensis]|nr:hypothetical protein Q1695_003083 [Nippostrongylus brasiliensis]WKY11235.1 hypothetical protein Q1695_003084 [Nippostrongylus brasiliensis]
MLTAEEVKSQVKKSLESSVPIGTEPSEIQGAKDFYKYMFTHHADLRRFFKGAQEFTAEDVQNSERFEKQGQRILLAVYILANTFDDEKVFRAYVRETINRHRQYKMEPELWAAFFTVYANFLDSRGALTDQQKAAWKQMGEVFDDESQKHLKSLGLPHV